MKSMSPDIKHVTADKDTPLIWNAHLNLDTTEAKGPFILAISQPLEYSFDITSQTHLLTRGTPITGLQLKAIVDQIDIKATLIIVFGGGLNIFRHSVINSIGFTEVKPQKSEASIAEDAKEQALAEEKSWLDANKDYFKELQSQRGKVEILRTSELMKNLKCQNILAKIKATYQEEKSPKLTKLVNTFAENAMNMLYVDLLRLSKSTTTFHSTIDNSLIGSPKVTDELINATKEYIFHEFALLAYLAKENNSQCLLYQGKSKKEGKHQTKPAREIKSSKQSIFASFAPKLINLIMELVSTDSPSHSLSNNKQYQIRYKEFFLEARQLSPTSGQELLSLFHLISVLPSYFIRARFPKGFFIWQAAIKFLDKQISDALIRASSEGNILESSLGNNILSPITFLSDLDRLVDWMGKFIVVLSILPDERNPLNSIYLLIYQNVSEYIAQKINDTALKFCPQDIAASPKSIIKGTCSFDFGAPRSKTLSRTAESSEEFMVRLFTTP